ncbi:uncharacterized protein BJ171DRAFT_118026 [Polychytrium aggregatum]|uniref:uncharacterized protein n=1 Tax=Polychytrium aggregatum TaxID=110093 RepID=UPI0022FE66C5|nr:uncharacterized protein BJ171DRAFT_118026 [Polychytrium aggregatum]KAI9209463.1 hypothetical protein BJ171DRAFT_118026 [Polychytrium aggregatum]
MAKQNYEVPYPQPDDDPITCCTLHITHLPTNYSKEEMTKIFKVFSGFLSVHFYGKYGYAYFDEDSNAAAARNILRAQTNLVVSFAKNAVKPAVDAADHSDDLLAKTAVSTIAPFSVAPPSVTNHQAPIQSYQQSFLSAPFQRSVHLGHHRRASAADVEHQSFMNPPFRKESPLPSGEPQKVMQRWGHQRKVSSIELGQHNNPPVPTMPWGRSASYMNSRLSNEDRLWQPMSSAAHPSVAFDPDEGADILQEVSKVHDRRNNSMMDPLLGGRIPAPAAANRYPYVDGDVSSLVDSLSPLTLSESNTPRTSPHLRHMQQPQPSQRPFAVPGPIVSLSPPHSDSRSALSWTASSSGLQAPEPLPRELAFQQELSRVFQANQSSMFSHDIGFAPDAPIIMGAAAVSGSPGYSSRPSNPASMGLGGLTFRPDDFDYVPPVNQDPIISSGPKWSFDLPRDHIPATSSDWTPLSSRAQLDFGLN